MRSYTYKGLDMYIFNKDIYGYKLVTTSNGYRCRYMDYTNQEILSKLKREFF